MILLEEFDDLFDLNLYSDFLLLPEGVWGFKTVF